MVPIYQIWSNIVWDLYPFNLSLPADDPLLEGMPGKTAIGASDGYWIFLEPLDAGPHQIDIDGTISKVYPNDKEFCVHVTYHLAVSSAFPAKIDTGIRTMS